MRLVPLVLACTLLPGTALGWSWQDLWKTPQQQLSESEAAGNYDALLQSESTDWQGTGRYRTEDFAGAADTWAETDSLRNHYNRGTALTRAGDFDAAIEAFDKVLSEQPDHENAAHNRSIAEQLKELQQQQQQQNGQNGDEQDSQQQDSESGENNSESGDSSQDQQSQQQQEKQQEGAEQESSSQEPQSPESEQEQSQSETDQAQSAQQQAEDEQQQQQEDQNSVQAQEPLSEDQQATEQWLRRIPDDPSGLLRRKLIRSHQIEYPGVRNGASPW